ncbi:hypothetical protein Tco_0121861 [Tanacetum coccineum]
MGRGVVIHLTAVGKQRSKSPLEVVQTVLKEEGLARVPKMIVADAKSLWAAIKSRFEGNYESKKTQRNVLKHQFENLTTEPNESLPDIDQTDVDDLYNNLRVYEDEMKRTLSSTSNSQNLAFLSFENTSSTNEVSPARGNFGVNSAEELVHLVRVKRFIQKTGYFAKECKSGRNQGKRSYGDNGRRNATTNEPSSLARGGFKLV